MLCFIVVGAVFVIVSGSAPEGSWWLEKYNAPYHVALLKDGEFWCSGAIITKKVVVSVNQCFFHYTPQKYKVRAGSTDCYNGGQLVGVSQIIAHEYYHGQFFIDHDIALSILDTPLLLDGVTVATIPILDLGQNTVSGSSVTLSGWGSSAKPGYVITEELLLTDLRFVDWEECQTTYRLMFRNVTPGMICARPYDFDCQSDTGSPLVQNGILVGVKSWSAICGNSMWPEVFSSISFHSQWIKKKLITDCN